MMRVQALDFSVNVMRALLWQHNEALRLQSLVAAKQAWYDENQEQFWTDWVRDVFDLRTANDFGLTVWAIILNIPLAPPGDVDPADKPIWGFATDDVNFTNGNFTSAGAAVLTMEQRRLVLRLRYFQLVTRGTVPEVNAFMADLFADYGSVYVVDGLNMNARYVFGFPLPSAIEQVFTKYDLLPRPAGVRVDYVTIGDADGWGFGVYHENFTNGNFYHA